MGSFCAKKVGQGQQSTPALCWQWGMLEESTQEALLCAGSPRLFYFKDEVNLFDCTCIYSVPPKMYNSTSFMHAAPVWLPSRAARHRHDLLARAFKP